MNRLKGILFAGAVVSVAAGLVIFNGDIKRVLIDKPSQPKLENASMSAPETDEASSASQSFNSAPVKLYDSEETRVCELPADMSGSFDYGVATKKQPRVDFGNFNHQDDFSEAGPQLNHRLICPYEEKILLFSEQHFDDPAHVTSGGLIVTAYDQATGKIRSRYEYGGNGWGAPPNWELVRQNDRLILKVSTGYSNMGCTEWKDRWYDLKNNSLINKKEGTDCDWGDESP